MIKKKFILLACILQQDTEDDVSANKYHIKLNINLHEERKGSYDATHMVSMVKHCSLWVLGSNINDNPPPGEELETKTIVMSLQ